MNAEWKSQGEVPVIDNDDYFCLVEEFKRGEEQMVFCHMLVFNWTPSVYKDFVRKWRLFRKHVTCPLYAVAGPTDVERWEKFVTRLGFTFVMPVVCENGAERRLFVHIQNQEEKPHEPHVLNHIKQSDARVHDQ